MLVDGNGCRVKRLTWTIVAVRERLIRFLSEAFSRLDISYASQFLGMWVLEHVIA